MIASVGRALLGVALACAAAGCTDDSGDDGAVRVDWQEAELAGPPGPPGRLAVRDAAHCDGRWHVAGAVVTDAGGYRPAVWESTDGGRSFASVPVEASEFWAKLATISSVACRGDELAMVGARPGGAHGNPRVSTFYRRPDGVLDDVKAGMEQYGGPRGMAVYQVAAGPDGWLIAGGRTTGAAVWVSPDAREFTIVEEEPGLANDARHRTLGLDAVHDGRGWTMVGSASRVGRVARLPMAWRSTDGLAWTREEVPATDGFNALEQVTAYGDGLLAAGPRDDRFGLWRRDDDGWHLDDGFGRQQADARAAAAVSGLAVVDDSVYVPASDASTYHLWRRDGDGEWAEVELPARTPAGGDRMLTVEAAGDALLLLADDGEAARVWLAEPVH